MVDLDERLSSAVPEPMQMDAPVAIDVPAGARGRSL